MSHLPMIIKLQQFLFVMNRIYFVSRIDKFNTSYYDYTNIHLTVTQRRP